MKAIVIALLVAKRYKEKQRNEAKRERKGAQYVNTNIFILRSKR